MIEDEVETGVDQNSEPYFDRVIEAEEGYSEKEVERLNDYSENKDE